MALTTAANTNNDAAHVQVANVSQSTAGSFLMDVKITPASLADGTLAQRLHRQAYPQKGTKTTGTHPTTAEATPRPARPTHGSGS